MIPGTKDRLQLIEHNMPRIVATIKEGVAPDTVFLIVDMHDKNGEALIAGWFASQEKLTEQEARGRVKEEIAKVLRGKHPSMYTPTFIMEIAWEGAEGLLSATSSQAHESMATVKRMLRSGAHLVVAIGSGGNSYSIARA